MPSNMRRNRTRLPTWASTGLGFLPAIRSLAINIEIENRKMTHILDETILSSFIGGRFTPVKHGSAAPRICAGALRLVRRDDCTRQASQAARANAMVEISRTIPN